MNKKALAIAVAAGALGASSTVHAFTQSTHKQIAIDAVKYMQRNPDTTNFEKLKAAAAAAGMNVDEMADAIGQGAFDVDDFEDTFMCGAITGDCVDAPVFGIGSFVATYTAWWHFQNHTHGTDDHGNDLGGYDQRRMPHSDITDDALRTWLLNDHLDDGPGGKRGALGGEDSEYSSYAVTEANYRLESNSNYSMYEDFQTSPFQPIDNLGQYWYNQFLASPSFQTLGFALHTTDLLQPHHVWVTSGRSHGGWEGWVQDHYNNIKGTDDDITSAMNMYTPVPSDQKDIRSIMTRGGAFAYAEGGGVINSTDDETRTTVGKKVIPAAIAMVVHVLNHAADQFATPITPVYKQLRIGKNGKCMDIPGDDNGLHNGANIQLWDCQGHAKDQFWAYDSTTGQFRNYANPDFCMDNLGANRSNGGNIGIWQCHGTSANQKFRFAANNSIRLTAAQNMAVDANGEGNGDNITLWAHNNGANQKWFFGAPLSQYRALRNAGTGLCMDVTGGNNSNGTNVQQYQCNGSDAQLWWYDEANGYLRNKMGKCLDNTGNTANNGNVQIWDCVDSNNLRWDWVGNSLRSRHNNNIAVDAYGSGNGANIGQWTFHGGNNQRWNWQ